MKTNIKVVLMSCFFLFSLAFVMTSSIAPPDNSTCNQQCIELGDLGLNHGQCVSFCTSCTNKGNTDANCTCNFLDFLGVLEEEGINYGQCIKIFKKQ